MVDAIKSVDSKTVEPVQVARPKSMVIRFGRAIIVLVETSKRTFQLFQESMEQIREFFEGIGEAFYRTGKGLFSHPPLPTPYDSPSEAPSSTPRNPILSPAPAWKAAKEYKEYIPKLRTCKVQQQFPSEEGTRRPLLRLTRQIFKELQGPRELVTTKLGGGIPNASNCCFMASVIQALRFSPSFRKRLQAAELHDSPVVQELRKLYSIVEGKSGYTKRDLTSSEVNDFRRTCRLAGCLLDDTGSQEDAHAFCQFLLDRVGFEYFPIKDKHEAIKPEHVPLSTTNIFNKELAIRENSVVFQVAQDEVSDLKQLIQRKSVVEIEPALVRKDFTENHKEMTPELDALLKTIENREPIPVKQTSQLYRDSFPPVLPIYLVREDYISREQVMLNMRKITPNKYIEFPLVDMPGHAVRYEWLSAITREIDKTTQEKQLVNKESGHYGAWAQYHHKDKPVYAHFNSGMTTVDVAHSEKDFDSIRQNARLYIYEFVGIVKASS